VETLSRAHQHSRNGRYSQNYSPITSHDIARHGHIPDQLMSMSSRKLVELTGVRFGRLCVIGLAPEKRYNKPAWLCRCDCGRVKVVPGHALRIGKTRSCGCLHKEVVAKQAPMAAAARWRKA
jgi:hypothetical protein